MFDASDSVGDSVDRSRRQPMRRYILETPVLPTKADRPPTAMERQLSDIFIISSNLQALSRHRHGGGAARDDYSTTLRYFVLFRPVCRVPRVLY